MSNFEFRTIFIICSLLFAGCGGVQPTSPMPTSTLHPTLLIPTSNPILNNCSKPQKSYKTFVMPESWKTISDSRGMNIRASFASELEQNLLEYLNSEGTSYQLQNDLIYTKGVKYADIREYDLDNDSENEIVIALEVNKTDFSEMFLLIAKCIQDQYQFAAKTDSSVNPLMRSPRILLIKDINKNGYSEVVWKVTWAGSDPFPIIDVVAWDEKVKNFVNIFDIKGVPYGDVEISIGDIDNNGIDEIILYGRYEHFGNETVTYTYAWNGKSYTKAKEEVEP